MSGSFQQYLQQLPAQLHNNSEVTNYMTAETLNQLAQELEMQLDRAVLHTELRPDLQPELTADMLLSILLELFLYPPSDARNMAADEAAHRLEKFYQLIKK